MRRPVACWVRFRGVTDLGFRYGRADLMTHSSVDITIPVLNEQRALESTLSTPASYLLRVSAPTTGTSRSSTTEVRIGPGHLLNRFAAQQTPVRAAIRLDRPGRGGALEGSLVHCSSADVVAYMDVDLSTGLESLRALLGSHCPG